MVKCCAIALQKNSATLVTNKKNFFSVELRSPDALKTWVKKNQLSRQWAVVILGPTDYQLLLSTKPLVADTEIVHAIAQQEHRKFSLPRDQLVIDYVDRPMLLEDKSIYVVAVVKQALMEIYQQLRQTQLPPFKITVPEFMYAHYVQRYYPTEKMVIWVNYFSETTHGMAFYQGELIATLKLPTLAEKMLSIDAVEPLHQFYTGYIQSFAATPLWLIHGLQHIEPEVHAAITGKMTLLPVIENSGNQAAAQHAYYAVLAYAS